MFEKFHQFHKTRQGYATLGVVELVLVYLLASIAVDSGSLWAYLAAIVMFVGALVNITAFLDTFGKRGSAKARK